MNWKVIYKNSMFVNVDSTVKLITFQSECDKPIIMLHLFVIHDTAFLGNYLSGKQFDCVMFCLHKQKSFYKSLYTNSILKSVV